MLFYVHSVRLLSAYTHAHVTPDTADPYCNLDILYFFGRKNFIQIKILQKSIVLEL